MTATVCRHHWRIADPDGRALLPLTCLNCGATKMQQASSYVSKYDFTIKSENHRSDPNRYQCHICGETYSSPASVGKCKRSHQ